MRRIAGILFTAACTAGPAPGVGGDPLAASFSPIGQHVIESLTSGHGAARGLTWDLSADDTLDPGWILQTPLARYWGQPVAALPVARPCTGEPGCDPDFELLACASQADCHDGGTCSPVRATVTHPGDAPRQLCVGHSDAFYDDIYDVIASAHHSVDVSSLGPPDGRFETAIRNALTYLANDGRTIRARVLWGAIPGASLEQFFPTTDDVRGSLVRDLAPASTVGVAVGQVRSGVETWNHAKVIQADGTTAIVGGHNLMARHYLQASPAFDLSMRVTGSAARQAARFADTIWRHTCISPVAIGSTTEISDRATGCDMESADPPLAATGTTRMITVGRLGNLGDNAADDAQVALVDAATSRLRVSQQDVGPIAVGAQWPEPYLRALVAASARGVDIELVISNIGAAPDGLGSLDAQYSNGWTPADVLGKVVAYAVAHPELVPGADPRATVCGHLHVASLRPSSDDVWPDGSPFGNHAKLVIADDQAFYLGSQNWYPANLVELGFIVDDPMATATIADDYFTPLWNGSRRTEAPCQ